MAFVGDDIMSEKNDDNISPYLCRPLRNLMEYLRETAQHRKQDRHDRAGETHQNQNTMEDGYRGENE
jgi:phosphopantetheine adenylyltransferase